jgi:hypothetical protein
MHLPWLAQQYERTCADCGHAWRVPRHFARRHMQGISNFLINPSRGGAGPRAGGGFDEAEYGREIQSDMEIGEEAESFRKCPECGSEHYSQRPVRS